MTKRSWNPIAFTPLPVTIIGSLVYAALITALLVVHHVIPSPPSSPTPIAGVNLTEAWQDLQTISTAFRPYNSHHNDKTRDWLLQRIESILQANKEVDNTQITGPISQQILHKSHDPAIIFSDMTSNFTALGWGDLNQPERPRIGVYFEGTNIIVYVRGFEDGDEDWWDTDDLQPEKGGVLINAHYDSVSTGYGATDDGVGVVSILQLIKYFTMPAHTPQRGLIALLNNGEEDFLNGARAFGQHPLSKHVRTFLNLEGAGAGGRATLFRSTDTEVTRAYQRSKHPFGSVISGDAFAKGVIKSETDYVVFKNILGARGLDIAFMEPRARYHTNQDDARHTSIDSLWHMLSASLSTVQALTSDESSEFDVSDDIASSQRGSHAVWFDLFGSAFVCFQLRTLFVLSVTLLVVTPIVVIAISMVLRFSDKDYLFSSTQTLISRDATFVPLHGWRGFFRYPFIVVLPCAATIGLAYLLTKINPFIIYSSPYSVWSMMLSAWFFIAWFVSCVADFWRPSAFHRAYSFLWLFFLSWIVLVADAVIEQREKLGGGYFLVFYFAAISLATFISFLELFGLSRKTEFAEGLVDLTQEQSSTQRLGSDSSERASPPSTEEYLQDATETDTQAEDAVAETTSLLQNTHRTTFARYRHQENHSTESPVLEKQGRKVYTGEQAWSWSLPTWTWFLQFLIIVPVPVILIGQVGLLFTSAVHQTSADGSSPLLPYIGVALFSVLILLPISPFLHRYTYHIPTFLFLVFVGTMIYNLVAFPFSSNHRLKAYFVQNIDLDTGNTTTSLIGIKQPPFLLDAISALPSSNGHEVHCDDSTRRHGLQECSWPGISPKVNSAYPPDSGIPPRFGYNHWVEFNVTRVKKNLTVQNEARISIRGLNTRACRLSFESPISDFQVAGTEDSNRFWRAPTEGIKEIRLWSRQWENTWDVWMKWNMSESRSEQGESSKDGHLSTDSENSGSRLKAEKKKGPENRSQFEGRGTTGLDGKIVCLWSDANQPGVIPALDEMRKYLPVWVAVSKAGDGLVEGEKRFEI
ncbi:MAG: hypothetical protein LQ351_006427 [Letrouitia transgressa]|nr:MAG: hypothetical protein LQ351_006427 [Letrouitia transgressa]